MYGYPNVIWAGESGVQITLPVNNSSISITGWACTMVVGPPVGSVARYTATPNAQGTTATYVTNGSEFPIAGQYNVELHATSGSTTLKSRVSIQVYDAYSP